MCFFQVGRWGAVDVFPGDTSRDSTKLWLTFKSTETVEMNISGAQFFHSNTQIKRPYRPSGAWVQCWGLRSGSSPGAPTAFTPPQGPCSPR